MLNAWFEAMRFTTDVQHVVALRLMRLAGGGPLASAEAGRMVLEKIAALGEAQAAMTIAMAKGSGLASVTANAYRPYRRRVRANCRRLGA